MAELTEPGPLDGVPSVVDGGRRGIVSVIMIFWNAEHYLREAVESVLAQTYESWELLLVDDGSTDDSPRLAQEFSRRDPGRIRCLTHPGGAHLGTGASRNLGLGQATGEFIAFLDADDVYLPDRLEQHVRILRAMPMVDMVQSEHIKWHTWGPDDDSVNEMLARPFLAIGGRILGPPSGLYTMLAVPSLVPGICDVTVRTGVARELGSIEPEFELYFEDQVFISKVFLERTVYALPAYLARYRRHPQSSMIRYLETTTIFDLEASAITRSFYSWLRNRVRTRGISDPMLDELLGGQIESSVTLVAILWRAGSLLVTRVMKVLRTVGAATLYRRALRFHQDLSWRRARRSYERLCLRISEIEARRAGLRRMDE